MRVDEGLIESARALGPVIRAHAPDAERERRLSKTVFEALRSAGLLRLYVPKALGGLEVDPVTCARVVEEVSGADSAAGWTLMVANSIPWWCARLPPEGARELYADGPDAVIASAFHPPVEAVRVAGGFRLNGRRPLASNVQDARWLAMTAAIAASDGAAPGVILAIFPAAGCRVHDTWYGLGMRGTDSQDVEVTDLFVPDTRTFPMAPEFEPGPDYTGPLYRMPAMGAAVAPWAPVALGVARRALDEIRSLATAKTPLGSVSPLRDRGSVQAKIGRAEAIWRSARAFLYEELERAWERTLAGEPSSLEQKAALLLAAAHTNQSCAEVANLVYGVAGTSAIYHGRPLERCFRDAQVLRQHGFFNESRYETAAQVFFGVDPEFGFVAF